MSQTKYQANFHRGEVFITTKTYPDIYEAWVALWRGLRRRGVDPGPWHMPGVVAGDLHDSFAAASRAGGVAWIEKKVR